MKRWSYFALSALLAAGLSITAFSQAKSAANSDPCAQYKTAPKGETADAKKKRTADMKACKAQEKQKSKPAKKSGK